MAKDSVKKRISGEAGEGMSFTEFSYQLLQGYDFLHLYREKGCILQLGGSDQWGNITTGTELIRRVEGGEAFGLVCPLITKADGGKFGKTESGNVWLDSRYTSPYKFYQFWLNVSDPDAEKYIKIFTSLSKETIEDLVTEQRSAPHLRPLQKRLAEELTVMVHSREAYDGGERRTSCSAYLPWSRAIDEETFLRIRGVLALTVSCQTGGHIWWKGSPRRPRIPLQGRCKTVQAGGGIYQQRATGSVR